MLFKWTTRFLTMLARVGMTIADVRHFFDVGSGVYEALTATAPDLVSRLEMEELAEMRPRDREDFIASTKNRFLGFLENPIIELVLGKLNQTLDVARLIQENAIIIISLERGGVLREDDVEILANLWLSEILYAVYNTPRNARTPHFVFLDELPVFQSSFDLLTQGGGTGPQVQDPPRLCLSGHTVLSGTDPRPALERLDRSVERAVLLPPQEPGRCQVLRRDRQVAVARFASEEVRPHDAAAVSGRQRPSRSD